MWEDLGSTWEVLGAWSAVVLAAGVGLWHISKDEPAEGQRPNPPGTNEVGDFPCEARTELLDIAYEQAVTGLGRQAETVERLRNRAMTFVAALTAIIAVFGEEALRGGGLTVLAVLAALAAAASLVFGIAVAAPRPLAFGLKPAQLLEDQTWRVEPRPREWAIRDMGHYYERNGNQLDRMHRWHQFQLTAGGLSVATAVAYVLTANAGG